jgi:hypothetical protein
VTSFFTIIDYEQQAMITYEYISLPMYYKIIDGITYKNEKKVVSKRRVISESTIIHWPSKMMDDNNRLLAIIIDINNL